ncbi:odorant receptor 2a [Lasius niger]|uniref:Odorant receptor 2a n=1 Tax=Lasius niger TaxID=67767 RepID=A0A0J7L5Y5_LASNI|nr:odorant receptor 2a [Lasius niger]
MSTSTISLPLKIGLGFIGMWPGSSYGTLLWLFYMATIVVMQYLQYSYVFAHLAMNDFSKLMDGLSVTLDYTLTFLKLLSLWHNRRCLSHRTMSAGGGTREFPVQMQFPFDHATDSPIFELILLGYFLHVWETATVIAMLNSLILALSLGTDMENKSGILIQSIIPYIAVTLEAFVFCFAGEYLSSKSKSIGDAAYETLWYELSTRECQVLLLIIVRSQKKLTITAGKIMDLTLEGFTTVRLLSILDIR